MVRVYMLRHMGTAVPYPGWARVGMVGLLRTSAKMLHLLPPCAIYSFPSRREALTTQEGMVRVYMLTHMGTAVPYPV